MKEKGIIVKIKASHFIVLSKNGTYHKVPISGRTNFKVGSQIEYSLTFDWIKFIRPAAMVASILILVFSFGLYQMNTPEVAAYVSLDINPSLELEVDRNQKVVRVNTFNDEARQLVVQIKLQNTDLYTYINSVLTKAMEEGYLSQNRKGYILTTVTSAKDNTPDTVNYDKLTQTFESSLENKGLNIDFSILSADLSTRKDAMEKGISPAKLLIYKNNLQSSNKVSVGQVKQSGLTELADVYKVKLLPNNKKQIIKSVTIYPYSKPVQKDTTKVDKSNVNSGQGNDNGKNKYKSDKKDQYKNNRKINMPGNSKTNKGNTGKKGEKENNNLNNPDTVVIPENNNRQQEMEREKEKEQKSSGLRDGDSNSGSSGGSDTSGPSGGSDTGASGGSDDSGSSGSNSGTSGSTSEKDSGYSPRSTGRN